MLNWGHMLSCGLWKIRSHPVFWIISQCSWFLATKNHFQGQDYWGGGGRGRRGKWGEYCWHSGKAAGEGPWISRSPPSFPSCSPGSSAGVSSSCIRNQDSLEQFMLPNPHWQSRPTSSPLCIWRSAALRQAHLTIGQRETGESCRNESTCLR